MVAKAEAWRFRYAEAVRTSSLKPLQRLVALEYADHLHGDEHIAWVARERLCERTGMSRTAVTSAVAELVKQGWLVVATKAKQHYSPRYLLAIPNASGSSNGPLQGDVSRPAEESRGSSRDTRGPSDDTRGPSRGPEPLLTPSLTSSSSAGPERHAARLLGWDQDDERLVNVQVLLDQHSVNKPIAWLTACHNKGTLEDQLASVTRPSSAWSSSDEDMWANASLTQSSVSQQAWEEIVGEVGEDQARELAEAESMKQHETPSNWRNARVVIAVRDRLRREHQWQAS